MARHGRTCSSRWWWSRAPAAASAGPRRSRSAQGRSPRPCWPAGRAASRAPPRRWRRPAAARSSCPWTWPTPRRWSGRGHGRGAARPDRRLGQRRVHLGVRAVRRDRAGGVPAGDRGDATSATSTARWPRCDGCGRATAARSCRSARRWPTAASRCSRRTAAPSTRSRGSTSRCAASCCTSSSGVHVTMVQMPAVNTPQFSWVLSRLPRQAQPVPPIYQPEVAARGGRCTPPTTRERREYWVGGEHGRHPARQRGRARAARPLPGPDRLRRPADRPAQATRTSRPTSGSRRTARRPRLRRPRRASTTGRTARSPQLWALPAPRPAGGAGRGSCRRHRWRWARVARPSTRGRWRRPRSADAVALGVVVRAGSGRARRACGSGRMHPPVGSRVPSKNSRLDADVVVEPLQVAQVGRGGGDVGVQVRRAVPGDLQAVRRRDRRDAQPLGDAAAARRVGLEAVDGARLRTSAGSRSRS